MRDRVIHWARALWVFLTWRGQLDWSLINWGHVCGITPHVFETPAQFRARVLTLFKPRNVPDTERP